MNSSLELAAIVLDVDRTLIRSVRNYTSNNPYPYYKSQHVEEYFHFTLSHEPRRSHSLSSTSSASTSTSSKTPSQPKYPNKPSLSSSPHTSITKKNRSHHKVSKHTVEHYHIYIRPGLKKLMTYLSYLQQKYSNVKIVIASMAKRDYIDSILRGLKKHCSERKMPRFDCILTRESWDENLSPSSTPTYPISVLLEQYAKHGFTKQLNLRFKSIHKIAETLHIAAVKQILVVDDDLGYYDHDDRVSGQIYQIPAWNGPISHSHHRSVRNKQNITLYAQSDNELPSLGAMIQAIVDKGSIQKYLFTRVLSVFRHEYGSRYKKQMRLRKKMMNTLMHEIGMEIDEDTAISSLWIFDNILRCCVADRERDGGGDSERGDGEVLGEYMEILFGCIIVYQMYIYDVHPSAHFYRLSFTQNEFWKQVMDVFFEYYVRLLFHINDSRLQHKPRNPSQKKSKSHARNKSLRAQMQNKFISITNISNKSSAQQTNVSDHNRKSIIGKASNNCLLSDAQYLPPIEVAQSEPELQPKCDIIAQEEVIICREDDQTPVPHTNDNIILTQEVYKSIQDNLKVLVKSISSSIFCKNLSPVCFIGYNLLSASRTNPVPKCVSKYQRILKKVYRDRNIIDL